MSAQPDRSIERQGPLAQEQKGAHRFALGWACGFVIYIYIYIITRISIYIHTISMSQPHQ